jgi:hypothetical protein
VQLVIDAVPRKNSALFDTFSMRAAKAGSAPSKRTISLNDTFSSASARRIFSATSGRDGNSSERSASERSSRETRAAVALRAS